MIKTILLDLDDTLLQTDTNEFVQQYIVAFSKLVVQHHPHLLDKASSIGKALGGAVTATVQNLDPTRRNIDVFSEALSAYTTLSVEALAAIFEEFHSDTYIQLVAGTQPVEQAPMLLKYIADSGFKTAIATNPLFTLEAVRRRIERAGLDSLDVSLAFISNMEECHFAKPTPHYYEEVIARIGAEADQAIMVGDDLVRDILPAAQAGISTFWLNHDQPLPVDFPAMYVPDGMGTLADFDQRLRDGWLATLQPRPRTAEQVVPRLMGNVGALFGLVDLVTDPEFWDRRPDPAQWSLLEIVCHLRDSERNIQRPRLQRIAREDNPFISQPAAPPGPGEVDLSGEDGYRALRQFWEQRCQTLEFLKTLESADWHRPARHSIFGPTSLLEMAHFTARHDHLHINQLCETLGRCRSEEPSL